MSPKIKIIQTSDGPKLHDGKGLRGSVSTKPKTPKANMVLNNSNKVSALSQVSIKDKETPVLLNESILKASKKFESTKKNSIISNLHHIRYNPFFRYADEGEKKPEKMAKVLYQHMLDAHNMEDYQKLTDSDFEIDSTRGYTDWAYSQATNGLYDEFDKWHEELHAEEVKELLNNKDNVSFNNKEKRKEIHYHAKDIANDNDINWTTATDIFLKYPVQKEELTQYEKRLSDIEKQTKALYARKLREAKESGLYNAIKLYGILEPILIEPEGLIWGPNEGFIADGYHRLACILDIDPTALIPTKDKEW